MKLHYLGLEGLKLEDLEPSYRVIGAYLLVPIAAGTFLSILGKSTGQVVGAISAGVLIALLGIFGDALERARQTRRRILGVAESQATAAIHRQDLIGVLKNVLEASSEQIKMLREHNAMLAANNRLLTDLLTETTKSQEMADTAALSGQSRQDATLQVARESLVEMHALKAETVRLAETLDKLESRSFQPLIKHLDPWIRARDARLLEMFVAEIDRALQTIGDTASKLLLDQGNFRNEARRDYLQALEAYQNAVDHCQALVHGPEGAVAGIRALIDEHRQLDREDLAKTLAAHEEAVARILDQLPASLESAMKVPRQEMSQEIQRYAAMLEKQQDHFETANRELDELWSRILQRT